MIINLLLYQFLSNEEITINCKCKRHDILKWKHFSYIFSSASVNKRKIYSYGFERDWTRREQERDRASRERKGERKERTERDQMRPGACFSRYNVGEPLQKERRNKYHKFIFIDEGLLFNSYRFYYLTKMFCNPIIQVLNIDY